MGSIKQAQTLARLAIKAGKITPAQAPDAIAHWIALPSKEVSDAIDQINTRTGFDAKFAPASEPQRGWILDLELELFGKWQTTADVQMTYSEADSRIKSLRATKAERKKPVTTDATSNVFDIFSKKAV